MIFQNRFDHSTACSRGQGVADQSEGPCTSLGSHGARFSADGVEALLGGIFGSPIAHPPASAGMAYFDAVTACSRVSRIKRVYGIPRALARAFTATSNGFGTRMLICSSFFPNSNRVGLNCEKSRLERSWARNASACLSVFRRGTFLLIGDFFISCYLPGMHISSGHRTDQTSAIRRTHRESHKEWPPGAC